MPKIGLRYLKYANYREDETGLQSYSDGGTLAKLITLKTSINFSEAKFFADDAMQEYAKRFTDGKIDLEIDNEEEADFAPLLGYEKTTVAIGTEEVEEYASSGEQEKQDVGVGFVETFQRGGKMYYKPYVLPRVQFFESDLNAETKGENLTFKATGLSGIIMRDHKRNWKYTTNKLEDELLAIAWIDQKLMIEKP